MDNHQMRKLLAEFVFLARDLYVDREVMRATLEAGARRSRVLADWEEEYLGARQNPPALIAKGVGELFQPLIDGTARGLDDTDLAQLVSLVQKLGQGVREAPPHG
jgi:hypothetical protein